MKSIEPEDFQIIKEKFSKRYQLDIDSDCWTWDGKPNQDGYGVYGFTKSKTQQQDTWLAHRLSWELFVGKIPQGFVIDHLCSNKLCVNPKHLNPTTNYLNSGREQSLHQVKCANPKCENLRSRGRKGLCERCRDAGLQNIWKHLALRVSGIERTVMDDPFKDFISDFPVLRQRLMQKIIIDEGKCWNWTGEKHGKGYGRIEVYKNGSRHRLSTHRLMFRITHGSLESDYVIDHLCSNRLCINPEHLEAVSMEVNSARAGRKNNKFNFTLYQIEDD